MASRRPNLPPSPVPKVFSSHEEIRRAISKIQRRIADVERLRDERVRHDDQQVSNVESAISKSVLEVFGVDSPEHQQHQHYSIVRAWQMGAGDAVYQREFEEELPGTLTMLRGLVASLEESAQDLGPPPAEQTSSQHGERERAEFDDLLPILRRRSFDSDLKNLHRETADRREPLALMMVDLDLFKAVNDTHGHPVGDEVLVAVAELLRGRTNRKGACYRYGGEEFAILLPNYCAEEAITLAELIRSAIEQSAVSSKRLRLTASFGIAASPVDAQTPEDLLIRADAALYEAKRLGRNRVRAGGASQTGKPADGRPEST